MTNFGNTVWNTDWRRSVSIWCMHTVRALHFLALCAPLCAILKFFQLCRKKRNSFSLEKCFVKSICSIFNEKVYFTEFFLKLEESSSLFYSPCNINLYQSKCWHCLLRKSETLKNPLHLLWVKKWSLDADKNDKLLPTWYFFPWGKNKKLLEAICSKQLVSKLQHYRQMCTQFEYFRIGTGLLCM